MKAGLILGIAAMATLGGWGWKTTQATKANCPAPPSPQSGEPVCELCFSPGSRASLILAAAREDQFVFNQAPLTEAAIAKALTRSEESVKDRARADGLKIAKLR